MRQEQCEPRWWQRVMQKIASTRVGAWVFSHTTHHIDRVLMNISGGRVSTSKVLAGLPTVRLTTIGANTGKERTVPVMGIQDGEKWIVIASSWGSDTHPAWYYNLKTNPEVQLTYNDHTNRYIAREATGDERVKYWKRATQMYIGFEPYQRRANDRQIPVIVLTPTEE